MYRTKAFGIFTALCVVLFQQSHSSNSTIPPTSTPTHCPYLPHNVIDCIGDDALVVVANTTPRVFSPRNASFSGICWKLEAVTPSQFGKCNAAITLDITVASLMLDEIPQFVALETWFSNDNSKTYLRQKCSSVPLRGHSRCKIEHVHSNSSDARDVINVQLNLPPSEFGEICLLVSGTDWAINGTLDAEKAKTSHLCVQRQGASSFSYTSCVEVYVPDLNFAPNKTTSPTPGPTVEPTLPPTAATTQTVTNVTMVPVAVQKKTLVLDAYVMEEDFWTPDDVFFHARGEITIGCENDIPFVCKNPGPTTRVVEDLGDLSFSGIFTEKLKGNKLTIVWMGIISIEFDSKLFEMILEGWEKAQTTALIKGAEVIITTGGAGIPIAIAANGKTALVGGLAALGGAVLEWAFDDEWVYGLRYWEWVAECKNNQPVFSEVKKPRVIWGAWEPWFRWGKFYLRHEHNQPNQ